MREQTTINTAFASPMVQPPLRPDVVGYRRWPDGSPGVGGGRGGFSESSDLDGPSEIADEDDELHWEAEASSGGGGYFWGGYITPACK